MMFWKKKTKEETDPAEQDGQGTLAPGALKVVIRTDLGNVRANNEDNAAFFRISDEAVTRGRGCLLLVADGMGGHLAGEVASKMAVDIISDIYFKKPMEGNAENALAKAFLSANKNIFELADDNEQYRGMGTTCTALALIGKMIYFAHVGDSRAYLFHDRLISRITEDHTYVQELVKNGNITPAEADVHPQRNILTNAMGTKPVMRVDTGKHAIEFNPGDRLLLCSDGLYDYLDDVELGAVLASDSLTDAADDLIAEAKRRGGLDNITVVLAEWEHGNGEAPLKTTRDILLPKMTRDADLPN